MHDDLVSAIKRLAAALGRRIRIMEVCGTHTHTIARNGLRTLMPPNVELVSGPGCPVCVTAQRDIERMLILAQKSKVTVCTFGDMMRVPGVTSNLERERSVGADVRVVYSATDALRLAQTLPDRQVVLLAVGFETTAPGVAAVVRRADSAGVSNFSIYPAHKRIVPAIEAVLAGDARVDGLLTPGHVSVIIGAEPYEAPALRFGVPCVATGFEPRDVLEGIATVLGHVAEGRAGSFVQYRRAIRPMGNRVAQRTLMHVFDVADAEWRGLGAIPDSGLVLKPRFQPFDAAVRFDLPDVPPCPVPGCRCGDVLKGLIHPPECALFRNHCTPRRPIGPCMVSSEGSCAAWYTYG